VIEADIPWDIKQVEEYGKEFTPWTHEQLGDCYVQIAKAMPNHKLTSVVLF
jgi:hypothetical protein